MKPASVFAKHIFANLKPAVVVSWFFLCFARVIRFMAAILGQVGVVCRPLFYLVFLSFGHGSTGFGMSIFIASFVPCF